MQMTFNAIVGDCGAGYLRVVPSAPCGMYICLLTVEPSSVGSVVILYGKIVIPCGSTMLLMHVIPF